MGALRLDEAMITSNKTAIGFAPIFSVFFFLLLEKFQIGANLS